jgi:hypothetical protein
MKRFIRDVAILPTRPSPAALILAIQLLLAGCAAERASTQRGESGPIAWEVVDVRQSLEEQGNQMRWDYTLVLRNTGPTTITLDQTTVITMIPGGNMFGGHTSRPYSRILRPGGEVCEPNNSYSHRCTQYCDPQKVRQMFRNGVTRVIELRGRDDAGDAVTAILRVRLDSTVGLSSGSSVGTKAIPVREFEQIAGKWQGWMYGAGSGPATLTIERDGKYVWRGDREGGGGTLTMRKDGRGLFQTSAGRTGTLALHERDGRRLLKLDYDGTDWKGELTPAE